MQNVLLQMGLRLTTPDGVRVSELRRWVLRCHACGDVTKQTTRVFCAKCGNATLQKVQHTVGEGGAEQFGVRRKHKIRGTRFSLPAPKGGRREKAPILREDQLIGMRGEEAGRRGRVRGGVQRGELRGELARAETGRRASVSSARPRGERGIPEEEPQRAPVCPDQQTQEVVRV